MASLRTQIMTSREELREHRAAWDDLWRRSALTNPLAMGEPVACWLEHFASRSRFRAVVVERDGEFVAALPLVDSAPRAWLRVGGMTGNDWSGCGGLLLDDALAEPSEKQEVTRLLVAALRDMPWPLLWIDECPLAAPAWRTLVTTAQDSGMPAIVRAGYDVNTISLADGMEGVQRRLSKNARKQLRRDEKRLAELGPLEHRVHQFGGQQQASGAMESLLREAFAVEDRGWKGASGTSVLSLDGMLDFFVRSAGAVAHQAEVHIHLLTLNQRPIAFQFGYLAKGVFQVHKIGFDQEFAHASPGHLLRLRVLNWLCEQTSATLVDCLGPRNPASDRWATETYGVGRIMVAPRSLRGRALLAGYRAMRPAVRWMRSGFRSLGG